MNKFSLTLVNFAVFYVSSWIVYGKPNFTKCYYFIDRAVCLTDKLNHGI